MTHTQLMTLCLAVIIPLSLLIYSNSRITEAKETLRAEIGGLRESIRAEIGALQIEITEGFSRTSADIQSLKADLKVHELEHHRH